ncbi:MAG: hypothetical protein ABR552_03795 [Actinomycetota bacterium]
MRPEDLYALPLDEFTAKRNELAKELRRQGKREDAARVASLKKPSVPAWAIDQAVRGDGKAARALLDAGAALREAQKRVVRGGDPSALRDAQTDERRAIDALTKRAVASLDKVAASTIERIRATLEAVSTDADLQDDFLSGALAEEHQRVGFGEFPDLKLVPSPPKKKRETPEQKRRREQEARRSEEREERLVELRAQLTEAEDELADLERRARNVRKRADAIRAQIEATGR